MVYIVFSLGCDNPHCPGYNLKKVFDEKIKAERYILREATKDFTYVHNRHKSGTFPEPSLNEYLERYEIKEVEVE